MRFGIDIDGILGDFNSAFCALTNKVYPGKLDTNFVPTDWDWSNGLTSAEHARVWEVLNKTPNFWLGVPPLMENVGAIARHRRLHPEDELFFVTARQADLAHSMPAMHQTQIWLNQCGIGGIGTSVIVANQGKVDVFNALECDANIDDKLSAVVDHAKYCDGSYLLDTSMNRDGRPPRLRVVTNLTQFFKEVRNGHGLPK